MGHYDNCRDGYCPKCGQGDVNYCKHYGSKTPLTKQKGSAVMVTSDSLPIETENTIIQLSNAIKNLTSSVIKIGDRVEKLEKEIEKSKKRLK